MESVYFYEKAKEKNIIEILGNDEFMRLSHVIRESNVVHGAKKGCILYVNGNQNEIDSIAQKLKDMGAEKVTEEEEKTIINSFKVEEENAASGIGLIFG